MKKWNFTLEFEEERPERLQKQCDTSIICLNKEEQGGQMLGADWTERLHIGQWPLRGSRETVWRIGAPF